MLGVKFICQDNYSPIEWLKYSKQKLSLEAAHVRVKHGQSIANPLCLPGTYKVLMALLYGS